MKSSAMNPSYHGHDHAHRNGVEADAAAGSPPMGACYREVRLIVVDAVL